MTLFCCLQLALFLFPGSSSYHILRLFPLILVPFVQKLAHMRAVMDVLLSSVKVDNGSVQPGHVVWRHESHQICQLFRLSQTSCRHLTFNSFSRILELSGKESSECSFGWNGSWRDGIETESMLGPFDSQGLCHVLYSGLRNCRRDNEWGSRSGVQSRDAQHTGSSFLTDATTAEFSGDVERSLKHDVDDGSVGIGREPFGGHDEVASRVVDEDVRGATESKKKIQLLEAMWFAHFCSTSSNALATFTGSFTSIWKASHTPPVDLRISSAVFWRTSSRLAAIATLAPRWAKVVAMAFPRPVPPPVTSATFPWNKLM